MKKYYFNGKEFNKNDMESLFPILEEFGLISSKEVIKVPTNTCHYITNIAKKLSKSYNETISFMKDLIKVNRNNALSLLLKEISREYDNQYTKSVIYCSYFYVFNFLTYSMVKVSKGQVNNNYNYTSLAYFRTEEEANEAYRIALNIISDIDKAVINKNGK